MDVRETQPGSHQWIWIAAIWFGLGIFDAVQTVFVMRSEGMHHAWGKLFAATVVSWLPWALATPLILHLGRRFPPATLKPYTKWLVHTATCAMVGILFTGWTTWLELELNVYATSEAKPPLGPVWLDKFCNGLLSSLLLYATILMIGYLLDARERLIWQRTESARLSEQLSRAQLSALRRQMEPHFLFNSLNAVSALVREGRSEAAISVIAGLSDLLRRVLEDDSRQQVSLGEEMEFVRKYMDIQKMRFAERLQLSIDVNAGLYPAQVPSFILQPMVENAVKHGIAKRAGGGLIRIAAFTNGGRLTLTVSNEGPALPADWELSNPGVGLSNVRNRLRSLYGDQSQLSMRNQDTGGVEVTFSIPLVTSASRLEA